MGRPLSVLAAVVILCASTVGCGAHGGEREVAGAGTSRPAVFFGLDVPHAALNVLSGLQTELGYRPTVFSAFIRYDSTNTADIMARMSSARVTPFITLEPWHQGVSNGDDDPQDSLQALIDGSRDAALLTQARALATYHGPIYLRLAHEMNAAWYPWGQGVNGNTAADYVAAWRHVHDLFATVPGLTPTWVWSPAAVGALRQPVDLAALYPGDAYVDAVGMTGYGHHDASVADTCDPTLAQLRRVSAKPVVLSEIGADGPDKSGWLRSLGPYLRDHPQIIGFVYFHTTQQTTGATGHYAVDDPTDVAALQQSLQIIGAEKV